MKWTVLAASAALVALSCSSQSANDSTPARVDVVPPECASITVDRFKELAVVDDGLTSDARTLNASRGAWSFAHLIEEMTPAGMTPSQLVYEWLLTWTTSNAVNVFRVDARTSVMKAFLCPWLQQTASNQCDATCSTCAAHDLDLSAAPLRLIGFANRLDLRETEDLTGAGEGRFVFAMTHGPADDPANNPMLGTVNLEYRLPVDANRDVHYWAERWHHLGTHAAFDDDYKADLQSITDEFSKRGAAPDGSSALNQLRVNEKEFDWQWDLREYKLTPTGFVVSATRNSPDATIYDSPELSDWITKNKDAIFKNQYTTPPNLTGGQSQPLYPLTLATLPADLRKQFAQGTCAGCHQLEQTVLDVNFHYSPLRRGTEKVSPFLNSPGKTDELTYREHSMQRGLCGK